jgi:hypothetical protein
VPIGSAWRGRQKLTKTNRRTPANLINPKPTHPHPPHLLTFVLVHFRAFLGKILLRGARKVHVESLFQKNRQGLRCQFFLAFFVCLPGGLLSKQGARRTRLRGARTGLFCFIAFSGVSQQWEFKTPKKKFCKQILSKNFYKEIDKKSKPDFSRFVLSLFGLSKTQLKKKHLFLTLVRF